MITDRYRTLWIVGMLALTLAIVASCSASRDLARTGETVPTTERLLGDLDDDAALVGGSAAAKELQALFDQLLKSDDACAILTRQDIEGIAFDPSAFASADARAVFANGLVDVYDHIAEITDGSIDAALSEQRSTFVEVLETVDRYAISPNSDAGNAEIKALVETPEFLSAQQEIGLWVGANCG